MNKQNLCIVGASLVAQLVKNLPAMWETWVRSLGWEDPLKKGKDTHSGILAWRFHGLYSPWGVKELDMTEQLSLSFSCIVIEIRPPTDSADERLSGKK